jgi:hypothetical protein
MREKHWLRVFENRVLRKIFAPKREEVTGEWRRQHNEELYYLYSSPNVIRVIKSRRMRWAGHVARMGDMRHAYRFWWGDLMEGNRLEGPGVDGRVILKCVLKKWYGEHGLD